MAMPEREALLEHVGFLRALALRLLRSEADADDVVQQTLLTALERPPAPGNLRAWLATVARNFALLTHRRRRRALRRELDAARPEAAPSPAEIASRLELERRVVETVAELEEPYRTTLILRFYDGLAPFEIARHLGVPAATVRVRLKRALARMRTRLEQRSDRKTLALGLLLLAQPRPARAAVVRLAVAATALVAAGGLALFMSQHAAPAPPRSVSTPRHTAAPPPRPATGPGAAARPLALRGRVIDARDRPRAGAVVVALAAPPRGRFTTLAEHVAQLARPPEPLARALSGEDGQYRLELPEAGSYLVRTRDEEVVVEATQDLSGLDFRLVGEALTRGRLLDGEGLALAGAWVSGATTDRHGWFELAGERELVVARVAGHALRLLRGPPFVVARGPGLAVKAPAGACVTWISPSALATGARVAEFPDEEPVVVVDAPGFAPYVGRRPVRLRKARTIEGVVQCDGEPVAAAFVTWLGAHDPAAVGFTQLEVARTDAAGRYRLTRVPPDAVAVTATHTDYLPRDPGLAPYLLGASDPGLEPTIEMVPAVVKEGRVVGPDGLPVAGARVRAWPVRLAAPHAPAVRRALRRAGLRWSAVSGPAGRYRLRQLPPGVALRVTASHPVQGRAAATDRFALTLEPWPVVEGRVVDEQGAPVAGARIAGAGVLGWSEADGRFVLHGRPAGELRIRHPAFATRIAPFAPRLVLFRGATIRGWVDAPGALVLAGNRLVRAGPTGTFELTGLATGAQRVEFHARGRVMRVVEANAGGADLEVALERAGVLVARVLRPGGAAVAGARVHAFFGGHAIDHALTDTEGRFRLEGVPERAPFSLSIRRDQEAELRADNVTAGGGLREFEMREDRR